MSTSATAAGPPKSPLERFLGLFSEVRTGEGLSVLLLALNIFLILSAYYVIKPVREALILSGDGAEVKSYAAAGQALLLLGAVPLYGWLAGRMPRRFLISSVSLFFVGCLVLFYLAVQFAPEWRWATPFGLSLSLGVVFFLWVGVFNLMVPAQFWAFANDIYTLDSGKRLFPIVAFGASLGAVLGSVIAGALIAPLGLAQMLLVAAAFLVVALGLTFVVDARERRRAAARSAMSPVAEVVGAAPPGAPQAAAEEPIGPGNAFALVFRSRYLLAIALLILLLNWVNTNGEFILGRTVRAAAEAAVAAGTSGGLNVGESIGRFYSDFFAVVNVVGLVVQLFLVSRLIRWFGIPVLVFALPLLAMGSYALLAFVPILSVVRWAKTAENATDYSLNNTVRQALFLPTTREEKYKAKQAIDAFFHRAGDLLSGALVFVGATWLALDTRGYALVNVGLVALWLLCAVVIRREYRKRTGGMG